MLQHEKGFFVLCRLMNVASAHVEIAAFLKAIQPHVPALLKDTKRGGQLHKAAWRLVGSSITCFCLLSSGFCEPSR